MNQLSEKQLMKRWRRQIASQARRRASRPPRPVAALGYLTSVPYPIDYVKLSQLTLVIVSDEVRPSGSVAIRVGGYGVSIVPHGVQWGDRDNERFYKDLCLCPLNGGRGRRLDRRNSRLLDLALQLENRIRIAHRYRRRPRRKLRLPRCWAGFTGDVVQALHGEGPEFEQLCAKFGMAQESMFRKFERRLDGLRLYPLEWVSGQLEAATTVFAELNGFPRRQVISLKRFPETLVGYSGANVYDLYASRFRSDGIPARPRSCAASCHVSPSCKTCPADAPATTDFCSQLVDGLLAS